MSNRIETPYQFVPSETLIIQQHFAHHNDWSSAVFTSVRANVIHHLRKQQGNKCCYCKRTLGFDIRNVEIDHIIPKSEYSAFTFHPENLALSCPGCNTKKGAKRVLKEKVVRYPRNGSNFIIIHAHFDDYYQHIDIADNCIYIAHTEKGSETITVCGLYRLKQVTERAKTSNQPKPSLITELLEELEKGDPDAKAEFLKIVKESLR